MREIQIGLEQTITQVGVVKASLTDEQYAKYFDENDEPTMSPEDILEELNLTDALNDDITTIDIDDYRMTAEPIENIIEREKAIADILEKAKEQTQNNTD